MAYLNITLSHDTANNARPSELIFLMAFITSLQVSGNQLTYRVRNVARHAVRRAAGT